MDTLEQSLPRTVRDLAGIDARWALVGGLAVCARAEPRPTADIDIAVAVPDDATAKARVAGLLEVGYRLREWIVHDQTGRLATARLFCPGPVDGAPLDLFFASSGVEVEIVEAAELLTVPPGLTIPVATLGHLLAVKLCWRSSPKRDRDLRALIERATVDDVEDARRLAAVITERGYHHGRDLATSLATWLADRSPPRTAPRQYDRPRLPLSDDGLTS